MINLTDILAHLPKNKVAELETVTKRIVETGMAEIVILFGSYARGDYKEERGLERGKKSDYDLLIATANSASHEALQSKLRKAFYDISVPVQLIIEEIDSLNSNLSEKQYFFTDLKREGKILYNTGTFELTDSKEISSSRRREIAEEDFAQWFSLGVEFYETSKFHTSRNQYGLAAFDLQQAVELCYTTIEMVFANYNPYEHNLKTLRDRTVIFDSRIKNVLPYETEVQQKLFDYLNRAYIGGRYKSKDSYPVSKSQLDDWSVEVQKLLELTELICKEHIESLRSIVDDS